MDHSRVTKIVYDWDVRSETNFWSSEVNTPIPLDVDLWRAARSDRALQITLFWGVIWGTSDTITTN